MTLYTESRHLSGRSALLLILVFVVAACDNGAPDVAPPAAVETCDGLVDIGDQLVRAYAEVLDQTDVGELIASVEDPNLTELERIGNELDQRATSLGCEFGDLNAAIAASTADLVATSPPVEVLLSVVRDGLVGEASPVATTTTVP